MTGLPPEFGFAAGSTATLTFTGIGAVIYGVEDHDQGIATYSVNGGTAHSVDDYSAARVARAPTTPSPWTRPRPSKHNAGTGVGRCCSGTNP